MPVTIIAEAGVNHNGSLEMAKEMARVAKECGADIVKYQTAVPELDFLTNTGVYVVEPRVVEEMRDGEKIGFPDVIERYRRAGEKVGVYPISESSWMDMGQLEELEKMRRKLENQQ